VEGDSLPQLDGLRFFAFFLVTGRTIGRLFLLDNFFTAFAGQYSPLNFTPHLWTIAFEEQTCRTLRSNARSSASSVDSRWCLIDRISRRARRQSRAVIV
jgi:hypothetical protein